MSETKGGPLMPGDALTIFPDKFTILAVCAGGWAKSEGGEKGKNLDEIISDCKRQGGYTDRRHKVRVYVRVYLCAADEVWVDGYGTTNYPGGCKSLALGYVMA